MDASEARKKFELADELYRDKRYTEALTVLEKLDAAFPNAKNVMYPRALCLVKLGRPNEAHEICQKLKAIYNDPRADKLMQKIAASGPQAPPAIDPNLFNQPGGLDMGTAFNPMDLNNIGPIQGAPGDPMGLGDLFAPKPGAAPPLVIDQGPNRKPLYIGLGVAGGVLLLALVCLPLFFGGGAKSGGGGDTTTQTGTTAEAVPQEIRWYDNYDNAMAAYDASPVVAPTLLFFYSSDSDSATQMMQETWRDSSVAYLVDGWTCVRIDVNDDPENSEWSYYYEIEDIPTTIVEDDWGGIVYEQSGFVSAREFYDAIQPLDLQVEEYVDFADLDISIAQALIAILLWIFNSGGTMYLTLLLVRKLPNEEFVKDIISATIVGAGVSVLFGCPCVGLIAGYFILHAIYEFEFIDYVAYLGISIIIGALMGVLTSAVLGIPFEYLIGLYT